MTIGPLGDSHSPVKNYLEVDTSIIVPRSTRVYVSMFMGESRYNLTWKEFGGGKRSVAFDDETRALSAESKLYEASLKNLKSHPESLDRDEIDVKTLIHNISECHDYIMNRVNKQVENSSDTGQPATIPSRVIFELKRLGAMISDLETKVIDMDGGDSK